jgi:hypothetical protein
MLRFVSAVTGCNHCACQNRKNSGVHPLLFAFGDDASVQEATSLKGHERGGRRVFDWEDQFEVYRGFHGYNAHRPLLVAQDRIGAVVKMYLRGVRVIYTLA